VVILHPAGPHWYRLQWADPDTGKRKRKAVPRNLTTKKAREEFRAELEKELNARRIDLDRGATKKKGTALADAVERYYTNADLTNETSYRLATGDLVDWHERHDVTSCDDVTAEKLFEWREHMIASKKKNGERRSLATVNTRLRKAKTALFYMHRAKLLPSISRDEISEACERKKVGGKKRRGAVAKPKPKQCLTPAELRDLFAALERHDADTYGETDRKGTPGRARRMEPLASFFGFAVLTGLRREELLGLTWDRVHLGGGGYLEIDEEIAKLHTDRRVALDVSPMARKILAARKLQTGGRGLVWPFTDDEINQALKRLRGKYDAPKHFTLKALRRTTATYLTSASGVYGGATVFHSAEQLGHSIETARGYYLHRVHGIDPQATTIEAALEITDELAHVVDMMAMRRPKKKRTA
jgi:integrase